MIERVWLEKAEFQTIEGLTVEEYMSTLSQKASVSGSYAGFSGSVTVNFDESHYSYSRYPFATVQTLILKYSDKIKLGTSLAVLKQHLTESAREAINDASLDPEDVFVTFGIHVFRGIVIGGRLDYNVAANMNEVQSTKSIGVFADAGYDGAFLTHVSSGTVTGEEMSSFSSQKKSLKVYGGSSEYRRYIIAEDEQGYQPWVESIGDNPVFCDFDRTTPVIAIWELCDHPARAAALESGYADCAAKRAINPTSTPHQCVVDIKLWDRNGRSALAYAQLNSYLRGTEAYADLKKVSQ